VDDKVADAVGAIANGVIVTGAGRGGSLAQWSFMTALSLDEATRCSKTGEIATK
jgi:hypothetical protein